MIRTIIFSWQKLGAICDCMEKYGIGNAWTGLASIFRIVGVPDRRATLSSAHAETNFVNSRILCSNFRCPVRLTYRDAASSSMTLEMDD